MSVRVRLLASTLALDRRLRELRGALDRARDGLLDELLSLEEKETLGVLLYDKSPHYRGASLFSWEGEWWDSDLPAPPARVLLGGAGSGREVRGLRERGYTVDAFEPAASHFEALCEHGSPSVRVARGTYADLVDGRGELARFRSSRYDAILLGWGSLTHVLGDGRRRALFRCLDELCPEGPLLASFFLRRGGQPWEPRAAGRGERLARALGRTLSRSRAPSETALDQFASYLGYAHAFDEQELQSLASACQRTLRLYPEPYAHATFERAAGRP